MKSYLPSPIHYINCTNPWLTKLIYFLSRPSPCKAFMNQRNPPKKSISGPKNNQSCLIRSPFGAIEFVIFLARGLRLLVECCKNCLGLVDGESIVKATNGSLHYALFLDCFPIRVCRSSSLLLMNFNQSTLCRFKWSFLWLQFSIGSVEIYCLGVTHIYHIKLIL